MKLIKGFYSRQGLWTLFLMSALPIHVWTIILALRDFDWASTRTNSWDAVGIISYGLLFAVLESLVLFIAATILGFFVSGKWEEKKRISLLSAWVIILSLWSIFTQTYFLAEMSPPNWVVAFCIQTGRPLVALYLIALIFSFLLFSIPAFFILRSDKALKITREVIDRLSLLMALYLVMDAAGLVIVIVRNL